MEQTALIVPVPAAEAAVAAWREELDPAASWGVPAHVTVLYPFLPPDRIDDEVLAAVRDIVAGVPRVELSLERVQWFGTQVVWLAPSPSEPFAELTTALWRRFPEAPPYGGEFTEVVPHLTVADGGGPRLPAAAAAVAEHLPIRTTASTVRLITGSRGRAPWPALAEFPLGPYR